MLGRLGAPLGRLVAGLRELRVRATDSDGRRQPDRAPDNDDGYLFSAVVRYDVDGGAPAGERRQPQVGDPGRLAPTASGR